LVTNNHFCYSHICQGDCKPQSTSPIHTKRSIPSGHFDLLDIWQVFQSLNAALAENACFWETEHVNECKPLCWKKNIIHSF
jgi:hypothetical protein